MAQSVATVQHYTEALPTERKTAFTTLLDVITKGLPSGFELTMAYGMPAFVVPHTLYPPGYHCNPAQPLPFISVANQKGFIAVYHMGLYAMPHLMKWFRVEYDKHTAVKLDMGKSCIRFKKWSEIPVAVMEKLAQKVTVDEWITVYETEVKAPRKK